MTGARGGNARSLNWAMCRVVSDEVFFFGYRHWMYLVVLAPKSLHVYSVFGDNVVTAGL